MQATSTVRTVLGEAATPEILGAWAAAYELLAEIMIAREAGLYAEIKQDAVPFQNQV